MKMLEDAEKKVEVLLEDTDGKTRPQPFPIDSEPPNHNTVIDEAASTILDEER